MKAMASNKAGLTLNDLYEITCMTHNRLSNFHGIYTIMQVVHTKFIQIIQPSEVQAKWFKNKLQQKQVKGNEKKRRVYK